LIDFFEFFLVGFLLLHLYVINNWRPAVGSGSPCRRCLLPLLGFWLCPEAYLGLLGRFFLLFFQSRTIPVLLSTLDNTSGGSVTHLPDSWMLITTSWTASHSHSQQLCC